MRLIPRSVSLCLLCLASSACGGGGGGGGAPKVVGVDLGSVAPNNAVTCGNGLPIGVFPNFSFFGGNSSCTFLTFSPFDLGPGASGTVTTASVRVGPVTGPMRFVKLRDLFQNTIGSNGNPQCCAVEEYGTPFTPQANAVTTVTLNFRMTWDAVPPLLDQTTVAGQDHIGLEVLAPNVPLPGVWVTGGQASPNATFIWLPAVSAQGFQAGGIGFPPIPGTYPSGFIPTISYTFVPN